MLYLNAGTKYVGVFISLLIGSTIESLHTNCKVVLSIKGLRGLVSLISTKALPALPHSLLILYQYCNLWEKVSLVLEWPKQMQPYLCGAEARTVTHKHPHTEAEIREETVPGLPIIRAEVYGRRELQGITEIKLHRRGTSNTGEISQALERMMGFRWVGNRRGEIAVCVQKKDVLHQNPSSSPFLCSVVLKYTTT